MQSIVGVPEKLSIEPCTHCQLHCPGCPNMDLGHPPGMGWGRLKFEQFRQLIDDNPGIRQVRFDCFGEIFINKDIAPMLDYGAERGIRFTFTSANFNHVPDATMERLVRHRVENVVIAIDGATPETYAIYRRKGDLNRVLANIARLNELKEQYESELPKLCMLWVVFGHNQHEIPMARKMAEKLGMKFVPKMQWDSSYSPITDPEQLKIELGWEDSSREEFAANKGQDYMSKVCHQLWQSPKINWDGRVLGCCWTQEGFGGNVFEDGFSHAINNDTIVHARRMLMGEAPARSDVPCTECPQYKKRLETGRFITEDELGLVPAGR